METKSVDIEPMFKAGEVVYTYFAGGPWPFKCKIIRVVAEEYGVFTKKYRPVYHLKIADQEWAFARHEYEISRTQSGLNRY
jgi:hypothetical protein